MRLAISVCSAIRAAATSRTASRSRSVSASVRGVAAGSDMCARPECHAGGALATAAPRPGRGPAPTDFLTAGRARRGFSYREPGCNRPVRLGFGAAPPLLQGRSGKRTRKELKGEAATGRRIDNFPDGVAGCVLLARGERPVGGRRVSGGGRGGLVGGHAGA